MAEERQQPKLQLIEILMAIDGGRWIERANQDFLLHLEALMTNGGKGAFTLKLKDEFVKQLDNDVVQLAVEGSCASTDPKARVPASVVFIDDGFVVTREDPQPTPPVCGAGAR